MEMEPNPENEISENTEMKYTRNTAQSQVPTLMSASNRNLIQILIFLKHSDVGNENIYRHKKIPLSFFLSGI